MKILIETENLIDFPYTVSRNKLFQFDEKKVNNLVSELMFAYPTCYLVSGYRGAGKTSFIKKIQEEAQEKMKSSGVNKQILFTYSSFSRYENQTNFLRKIIRDLSETILLEEDNIPLSSAIQDVNELRIKTFYEVREERIKSLEKVKETMYSIDISEFIRKLIKGFAPLLIPLFFQLLFLIPGIDTFEQKFTWAKVISYLAVIVWTLFQTISLTKKYSIKDTQSESKSESSITDDDVISYYLERLIQKFDANGYKLVFVLDELDKVSDEDFDKLLNEMKPWLVKGKADFIIIAGQNLTLKYYQMRNIDDNILASLFSKIIHVNLLTEFNFEKIFNEFLFKGIVADNEIYIQGMSFSELKEPTLSKIINLRDNYVFNCKRLPRAFMNLIRQDLIWEEDKAFLVVTEQGLECSRKKLQALKPVIDEVNFNAELPETIKDHIIMQLFIAISFLDCKNPIETSFEDFFKPFINDTQNGKQKISV